MVNKKLLNDKNCNFDDYSHLLFAFGKANEDNNEYQTAFAHTQRAIK